MITCLSQFYHHFKDKEPAISHQQPRKEEESLFLGTVKLSGGQEPPKNEPVNIVISKKSTQETSSTKVFQKNSNNCLR